MDTYINMTQLNNKTVYTLDGRSFEVINFLSYAITVSADIYDGKKNRKNKALLSLVKKENEEDNTIPTSMILVTKDIEIKIASWEVDVNKKGWIIAECIVDVDVTNL